VNAPAPEHVDEGAPKWCDFAFPPLTGVPCRHADESIVCSIDNGDRVLIVIALMVQLPDGPGGMFLAVPPRCAREIAAGLIETANTIDNGRGKQ
jgi:hypothetical protein